MSIDKKIYTGNNLRSGRYSIAGQIYSLTFVTQNRDCIFDDLFAARQAILNLHAEAVDKRVKTLAFVVMPDHMHWLMQLKPGADLSTSVRIYRSKVSLGVGAKIWQKGFHDRALRRDEDLANAARYIIANPVRAGIVDRVGDYPHWDAIWV